MEKVTNIDINEILKEVVLIYDDKTTKNYKLEDNN